MIYVHLGLHKTATTSLQQSIFPFIEGLDYLGRNVEDTSQSSSIYKDIAYYCFAKHEDPKLCKQILEQLRIHQGQDVLISEEWFTADYSGQFGFDGATWQEKLLRLSRLLADFEYLLFVTLRDPIDGLFSQYKEFCSVGLSDKYSSFVDYAYESNDSKVYQYPEFDNCLLQHFNNIHYFNFDDLKSGTFLSQLEIFLSKKIVTDLIHTNKRKTDTVQILNPSPIRVKFLDFVRRKTPDEFRKKITKNRIYLYLRTRIVNSGPKMLIEKPSTKVMLALQQEFESSTKFYEKLFCIK